MKSVHALTDVRALEKVEKTYFTISDGFSGDAREMAGAGRMTPIGSEMFLAMIGRLPDDPWQSLLVFATGCDRKTPARQRTGSR